MFQCAPFELKAVDDDSSNNDDYDELSGMMIN